MTDTNIGERFALIRADMGEGTPKSMSLRIGIGENAWRLYEKGTGTPGWSTMQRLVELGYNPSWLMTGQGQMRLSQEAAGSDGASTRGFPVDKRLMARVTDGIVRLHKDMGLTLAPARQGELVYEMLEDIGRAAEGPEEYDAQLEIMLGRLKRKLQSAIAEPGTGKRSAS